MGARARARLVLSVDKRASIDIYNAHLPIDSWCFSYTTLTLCNAHTRQRTHISTGPVFLRKAVEFVAKGLIKQAEEKKNMSAPPPPRAEQEEQLLSSVHKLVGQMKEKMDDDAGSRAAEMANVLAAAVGGVKEEAGAGDTETKEGRAAVKGILVIEDAVVSVARAFDAAAGP